MLEATMLYKVGGPHEIHGGQFSTLIVDAALPGAIEAAQADDWHLSTPEATRAHDAAQKANQEAKKAVAKGFKQAPVAWPAPTPAP